MARFAAADRAKPARPAGSRIECMETREVPGAFACGFSSRPQMNRILMRASVHSEGQGEHRKGTVIRPTEDVIKRSLEMGGHNLRHVDLQAYRTAMLAKCQTEPAYCPTTEEREFFEQFVNPLLHSGRPFILVTASLQRGETPLRVFGHEMLHAQYSMDERYRRVFDRFWQDEVPPNVQRAVKMHLNGVYDIKDEYVVKNEFQAYLFDPDSKDGMLGPFVPGWQAKLRKYLEDAGTPPLQLK